LPAPRKPVSTLTGITFLCAIDEKERSSVPPDRSSK
jgi:hypothetical protein